MEDDLRNIERAIVGLDAHDLPGALDALLTAWRAAPSAALAQRIERLDRVLKRVIPPLTGKTATARHADWLQLAGAGRAVDHAALAAGLAEPPMTRIVARLEWLLAQPPDPRWTRAVGHLFLNTWNGGTRGAARVSNRARKVLQRLGDPRIFEMLRGQRARRSNYWGLHLTETLERLGERIGEPAPPPADSLLERLDTALTQAGRRPAPSLETLRRGRPGEAEMQAMVHADPADVDTRRIFADWLEQSGSPRSELMRLQLKAYDGRGLKKDAKRVKHLIAQHGLGWLGPLAPFVQDVDWFLGFPAGADIKFRGRRQRDTALQATEWRTLTEATTWDPAVTHHPSLAQVRQLGRTSPLFGTANRVTPQPLAGLEGAGDLAITHLVLDADDVALVDFGRLPALRQLDIRHRNAYIADPLAFKDYMAALSPLRLERLTLWHFEASLWISLRRVLPTVERFEVATPWSFRYGLSGSALDVVWPWGEENRSFQGPRRLAAAVEPAEVHVHTPGYNHPASKLARWAAMLDAPTVHLPKARRPRKA